MAGAHRIAVRGGVVGIEKVVERLAVVNRRVRHRVAPHQLVLAVDIHVVLVAEVALAMLLRPARVDVLLRLLVGLPRDRRIAVLDRLVLFAAVALHGRRHDGGVDDLAAHGQVAPALQMGIEGLEQRLDQPRLRELLAIQPDRLGVGDPIREAQSQEAHEREPVADLILELVIGEIVERLQNQRLEDDDLVPRLASGRVLALLVRLAPNRAQLSAEILPGHNLVQENQRVLLGIKTAIALVKVEETRLTHFCPSLRNQHAALSSNSHARERSIFRGALTATSGCPTPTKTSPSTSATTTPTGASATA